VVIAGHDREFTTALFFPVLEACRKLRPGISPNASSSEVLARPEVRQAFHERLNSFAAASTGSSTRIERAILLDPPSVKVQEITDKGSINQKIVLANRAIIVKELYCKPVSDRVLTLAKEPE
jgi:feruloyl-CoA synthase